MEKGLQAKTETKGGVLNGLFDPSSSNGEGKNPFGSATPLTFSPASLKKMVKELTNQKGELEEYSSIQHLELIRIQQLLLEGITEEKIEAASLTEITRAYSILKEKQLLMTGKATSITGIVGYLIALEKEEQEQKQAPTVVNQDYELQPGSFTVGSVEETEYEPAEQEEDLPRL